MTTTLSDRKGGLPGGRDGPSFAALQTSECSAPLSRTLRCPRRHSLKQQELSNGGRDAIRSNVERVEGGGGIESHTAAPPMPRSGRDARWKLDVIVPEQVEDGRGGLDTVASRVE